MAKPEQRAADEKALVRNAFQKTRLFADWPAHVLDRLEAVSTVEVYRDRDVVARVGEALGSILVVAGGCVETSRTKRDGRRLVFDFLQPGQVTGLFPLFDGEPYPLDAMARGPTRVVHIPAAQFLDAVKRDAALAVSVIGVLCRRSRVDYERLMMAVLDPLQVQLSKVLLYMCRGAPPATREMPLSLHISQDDVAANIGVSRQSLNKAVRSLVKEGIISWAHNTVVVRDIQRLSALANENEPLSPEVERILHGRSPDHFRTTD